jgi:hypothetical protein
VTLAAEIPAAADLAGAAARVSREIEPSNEVMPAAPATSTAAVPTTTIAAAAMASSIAPDFPITSVAPPEGKRLRE